MKTIISRLFAESLFEKEEKTPDIYLFRRPEGQIREYYIAHFISEKDVPTYLEVELKKLMEVFEAVQQESEEVSKNSSLLLCVEYTNHVPQEIEERKRTIEIEEHQYDIRKYVVNYTAASIQKLKETSDLSDNILKISTDEERFKKFSEAAIADMEYFVTMQLLTKLPFLTLKPDKSASLESLDSYLSQAFGTNGVKENAAIVLSSLEELKIFTSAGKIEKEMSDRLLSAILSEDEDELLKSILEV